MTKPESMTKDQWLTLADGIARGDAMLTVSGAVGVDRFTLRQWFARSDMLELLARKIGTPDALDADAFEILFLQAIQEGERGKAYELRRGFALALTEEYPQWFIDRAREKGKQLQEEARLREIEEREAEERWRREEEEEAERERLNAECTRADYHNLSTLVELKARDLRDGTPAEIKKGLLTPEARERYRCAHGLRFTCAGFGVYYWPKWSACYCRLHYGEEAERKATGSGVRAFYSVAEDPQFEEAWKELEAHDGDYKAYFANPFANRDPKLPTTEAAALALKAHVEAGGSIIGWKWKPPRVTRGRRGGRTVPPLPALP